MSGSRVIISIGCGKVHLKTFKYQYPRPLVSHGSVAIYGNRAAHTQPLTGNLQYITNDKVHIQADPKTMKLSKDRDRPICIMLSWLLAPRKLTLKYANLYLEEGFDVVAVSIRPWQLMWPRKGAQVIGWDILRLMAANDTNYMVHGFSVGGYIWSEALVHAAKDLKKYQLVLDRVSAQVWDSVADITAVTAGVPLALFPQQPLLQRTMKGLLEFYLWAFSNIATKHYARASQTYYMSPCRAPCLFLLSSTDHVGAEKNIRNACQSWRDQGIKCTWQCWPSSPHVSHYNKHKEEYVRLLRTHIWDNMPRVDECRVESPQRMRAVA